MEFQVRREAFEGGPCHECYRGCESFRFDEIVRSQTKKVWKASRGTCLDST